MIFTVPLWGSEVANSKTEIHLTNTAFEMGMQRHIYAMSLLLNARVTLLRQAYATAFRKGCLTWTCDVTTIELYRPPRFHVLSYMSFVDLIQLPSQSSAS